MMSNQGELEKEVFHFTVSQLIEVLQTLPQELPVLVSGYETGYENFHQPTVITLKHEPENMYFEGEFQTTETGDTEIFAAVVLERVQRND
ncbi:MAG: hypothetical protein VR65_01665 [Desulfobulbaceae bacterium BRH_c16a]|nr:MAG: hypothetical protein VR65_01665 [Desulfobulbaceae bacterium BRH_c16a]